MWQAAVPFNRKDGAMIASKYSTLKRRKVGAGDRVFVRTLLTRSLLNHNI